MNKPFNQLWTERVESKRPFPEYINKIWKVMNEYLYDIMSEDEQKSLIEQAMLQAAGPPSITGQTTTERETHLNQSGDDKKHWYLFTEDITMMRKMDKLDIPPSKIHPNGAREFVLSNKNVTLRKPSPKRKMTEEAKQELRDRLAKARNNIT